MPSAKNGLSQEFLPLLDGFERSSEHVVVTDRNGRMLYANKAAAFHTGYSVEEMLGKKPGEVWGGHMSREWYDVMWNIIAGQKQAFMGDVRNKRKNGEMYWQQVHIIPVLDDLEEVRYYIGIELEVDAQSHKEEVMRVADAVDSAAHLTLRWPVGWLFEKGHLSHRELLDLQHQYATSDALDQMTDDLLALSCIHAAVSEKDERFSLQDLLRDIVTRMEKRFPDRAFVIESPNSPVLLQDNKRLVCIALERIITNAAQYAPAGTGEVLLQLFCTGKRCTVRCRDNGIGITEQERKHLFDKYFRGTRARILHPHGAGLGLFLVQSIANVRGWEFQCDSETDHGATFDLTMGQVV